MGVKIEKRFSKRFEQNIITIKKKKIEKIIKVKPSDLNP
jgi:hypothetical protein